MSQATPVFGISEKPLTNHLLIGKHIPKPEFSLEAAITFTTNRTGYQCLSINYPPVFKSWYRIWISNFLDERSPVEWLEQP